MVEKETKLIKKVTRFRGKVPTFYFFNSGKNPCKPPKMTKKNEKKGKKK